MGNRRLGAKRINALMGSNLAEDNSNATATAMKNAVVSNTITRRGSEIVTEICVDLGTPLAVIASTQNQPAEGGADYQQIIGVSSSLPTHQPSYLTRLTPAVNGYIIAAEMICTELPVDGELDIDLWTSDIATGSYSGSALGMTNGAALIAPGGDWSLGSVDNYGADIEDAKLDSGLDSQYVYLVNGAASAASAAAVAGGAGNLGAEYTSGKFVVRFTGVRDFDDKA